MSDFAGLQIFDRAFAKPGPEVILTKDKAGLQATIRITLVSLPPNRGTAEFVLSLTSARQLAEELKCLI